MRIIKVNPRDWIKWEYTDSRRIEEPVTTHILGEEHKQVDNEVIQSKSGEVFAMWKAGKLCLAKDVSINRKELNDYLLRFFDRAR